ncbi:hypothetical protein MMC12_004008 [Toensbergia leucococca]|nr:hypothetical protein [Toensbergia leucococca]
MPKVAEASDQSQTLTPSIALFCNFKFCSAESVENEKVPTQISTGVGRMSDGGDGDTDGLSGTQDAEGCAEDINDKEKSENADYESEPRPYQATVEDVSSEEDGWNLDHLFELFSPAAKDSPWRPELYACSCIMNGIRKMAVTVKNAAMMYSAILEETSAPIASPERPSILEWKRRLILKNLRRAERDAVVQIMMITGKKLIRNGRFDTRNCDCRMEQWMSNLVQEHLSQAALEAFGEIAGRQNGRIFEGLRHSALRTSRKNVKGKEKIVFDYLQGKDEAPGSDSVGTSEAGYECDGSSEWATTSEGTEECQRAVESDDAFEATNEVESITLSKEKKDQDASRATNEADSATFAKAETYQYVSEEAYDNGGVTLPQEKKIQDLPGKASVIEDTSLPAEGTDEGHTYFPCPCASIVISPLIESAQQDALSNLAQLLQLDPNETDKISPPMVMIVSARFMEAKEKAMANYWRLTEYNLKPCPLFHAQQTVIERMIKREIATALSDGYGRMGGLFSY